MVQTETIQSIALKLNIVDIIGEYVTLRPAGKSYKGLCPFHQEKTPSFYVDPQKGLFHCFGCGAGGNVYNFIMRIEKLTFADALSLLAQRLGIKIESPKEDLSKMRLYQLNRAAADFYHTTLLQTPHALNYLSKERQLKEDIIFQFKLGYAPLSVALSEHLIGLGYSTDELLAAGLVVLSGRGSVRDMFRGRIIFPIWDMSGNIVGFGARAQDNSSVKYLNTPQTSLYTKGHFLYGLNFAKEAIRQLGYALLVEGYMDVLVAFMHGFRNVCGILGTALTIHQAHTLRCFTDKVVVLFDQDKAGAQANLRSFQVFCEVNLEARIALLPHNLDPADYLNTYPNQDLERLINNSCDFFDYAIDYYMRDYTPSYENKKYIIEKFIEHLSACSDELRRYEYTSKLAQKLDVPTEVIWGYMKQQKQIKTPQQINLSVLSQNLEIQRDILRLMLADVQITNKAKECLSEDDFDHPTHKQLYKIICEHADNLDKLLHLPLPEGCAELLAQLTFSDKNNIKDKVNLFEKYYNGYIQIRRLRNRKRQLLQQLKENPSNDILFEYQQLTLKLNAALAYYKQNIS